MGTPKTCGISVITGYGLVKVMLTSVPLRRHRSYINKVRETMVVRWQKKPSPHQVVDFAYRRWLLWLLVRWAWPEYEVKESTNCSYGPMCLLWTKFRHFERHIRARYSIT